MAEISRKDREKLAKLFAQLGSDNANIKETALQKINEWLARNGKTWNDFTELLRTGRSDHTWDFGDDDTQKRTSSEGEPTVIQHLLAILQDYIDLAPYHYIAVALWILHTHVHDRFLVTPRLALTSPAPGCGKTELLSVLSLLCANARKADHCTAAYLYALIDETRCTALLDEGDNLLGLNKGQLIAFINSGHRQGGGFGRNVGGRPKRFRTFAPLALAAIGDVPPALALRSLIIPMERADGARKLKRLGPADSDATPENEFAIGYSHARRWAHEVNLNPEPEVPRELRGRQRDNWTVLLSIAESFGAECVAAAREAAVVFARSHRGEGFGVAVLEDSRVVFNARRADRLASGALVEGLADLDNGFVGWNEWQGIRGMNQPHRITQRELARLLRPFGIRPRSAWSVVGGVGRSAKSYSRADFANAWARYCADESGKPAEGNVLRQLRGR